MHTAAVILMRGVLLLSGENGFYCFETRLAESREVLNRKYSEVRSAEGDRRWAAQAGKSPCVRGQSATKSGLEAGDTPSDPIFCSDPPSPPSHGSRRQEATLPFIRSRMKHSLSGVWKAYVMHTMKGQSCER